MMEVVELPDEINPPRSNQFTVDDLDIEILPLIYEIIRSVEKDPYDNTQKAKESQDTSHKILELQKKLDSARSQIKRLPGIEYSKEEQLQKLETLRKQLRLKRELLLKYRNMCTFEIPKVKELCALHALNNLFQERGFSKQELDQICYGLSPDVWINPHKSLLGLGNYDINVIMAALQRRGCEAVWFDKRRDPKCLCLDNIDGFILNVPTEYKLGFVLLPLKRRHWVALRKIHGAFYNLDSKLDSPQLIGKNDELLAYLKDQIESKDKELFLVVSREVESSQGWLIESPEGNENYKTERDNMRYIEDGFANDIDIKIPITELECNENDLANNQSSTR